MRNYSQIKGNLDRSMSLSTQYSELFHPGELGSEYNGASLFGLNMMRSRERIKRYSLLKFSLRYPLLCVLMIASILLIPARVEAQGDPTSEVIRLVNELRISYGVPPYEIDPILMSVAQAQASWCAANNHIGHDGPGGSSPNDRAQAAGYGGGFQSKATENQAHGTASYHTPELVVTMWQGDWGHLNAMISPDYEHIGVGFAEAGGYSWYILMAGWVNEGTPSTYEGPAVPADAFLPIIPVVTSEPDLNGAIYHEVQPGQTAWTIAASYEVGLSKLLRTNNLTEDSILKPGDILVIRAGTPAAPSTTYQPAEIITIVPSEPAQAALSTPPPVQDQLLPDTNSADFPLLPLVAGVGMILLVGFAVLRFLATRSGN
jgi:hypothetical protein